MWIRNREVNDDLGITGSRFEQCLQPQVFAQDISNVVRDGFWIGIGWGWRRLGGEGLFDLIVNLLADQVPEVVRGANLFPRERDDREKRDNREDNQNQCGDGEREPSFEPQRHKG